MQPSRIIYFEIAAEDPKRCMEFYSQVFDWEFSALNDSTWLTRTGPDELPGINGSIKSAANGKGAVINTLHVKDLNQTEKAVEHYGGQIVLPRKVLPEIGWLLYFKDTEGNLHGALEPDASAK